LEVKVSRCTSMFFAVIPFPLAARFSTRWSGFPEYPLDLLAHDIPPPPTSKNT